MTMAGTMLLQTSVAEVSPETQFVLLSRGAGISSYQRCYRKGDRIYARHDPAHYVYAVVKGAVRASHCLADGRRHLSSFHFPGEIFGLDGGASRSLDADAVVETTMLTVRLEDLERKASLDAKLAWDLCNLVADDLRNARDHLLLLGRKSATEKVAAFLLEMDRRLCGDGMMSLPMCEQDIADYLGLRNETVSRCLTKLQALRIIDLTKGRTVTILDRAGLCGHDAS